MTTREKAIATRDDGFDRLMLQRARDICAALGIATPGPTVLSARFRRAVDILRTVDECARIEALRRAEEKTNG